MRHWRAIAIWCGIARKCCVFRRKSAGYPRRADEHCGRPDPEESEWRWNSNASLTSTGQTAPVISAHSLAREPRRPLLAERVDSFLVILGAITERFIGDRSVED